MQTWRSLLPSRTGVAPTDCLITQDPSTTCGMSLKVLFLCASNVGPSPKMKRASEVLKGVLVLSSSSSSPIPLKSNPSAVSLPL
jgi:hypothetical protein